MSFKYGLHSAQDSFMSAAIQLSIEGMESGAGGPFGCVVVKDNKIIGEGFNQVLHTNDPTAHAEIIAIRNACSTLGKYQLHGCDVYTNCEPCPMCMGAIYWARPDKVFYANTRKDAAQIGFDDAFIYNEIERPLDKRSIPFIHLETKNAINSFKDWMKKSDKKQY